MERICFYNSNQAWGGGEKWHFEVGLRLHKRGHHVIFFTNNKSVLKEKLKNTSIPVYAVQTSNLSFLNIIKRNKVKKILQHEKINSIILNLSSDVKLAGLAARSAGIKNIIYRRGLAKPIKNSFFNRYLFNQVITHVICNSHETKRTIFQNNPEMVPAHKVSIIYNGIDTTKIQMDSSEMPAKRDRDKIHIGNLGRLVEQKGQRHLIEMAALLTREGMKFHMFIGGIGPMESQLKNYAIELNVSDKITFTGFVSDVHSFMQNLDIFVLPSYWEGFGYVLVEAMVNALPVVAFDITSNPEIIDDMQTGFLCKAGDTNELMEQTQLLMNNPELRSTMGKAGRERVLSLFTLEKTVQETENLLASL